MSDLMERKDWKEFDFAMRMIAKRFDTSVHCSQKNEHMNVNFKMDGLRRHEIDALKILEDLVAQVSKFPEGVIKSLDPSKLSM